MATPAVTQKCTQCGTEFDARMFSCPKCGNKDGSSIAGGIEAFEIMATKQKAIEICDRATEPFNAGKLDEAIAIVREAIMTNPMYEQAHSNLGFLLTAKGDYEQAVRVFEHVLSFSPRRDEAQRGLATAKNLLLSASSGKPSSPTVRSSPPPTKGLDSTSASTHEGSTQMASSIEHSLALHNLTKLGRNLFFVYLASFAFVFIIVNFIPNGERLLRPIPDNVARLYFFGLPLIIGIVGLMLGIKKKRPGMGVLALILTPIGIWFAIAAKEEAE